MKLRTLLLALPAALLSLMLAAVAALAVEVRQSSGLLGDALAASSISDTTKRVNDACEAMTVRTVIWTVTRRNSERPQVAAARKACVEGVASLGDLMPEQRAAIEPLAGQAAQLASLLENIQAEYTEETKVATVGRLEREVKPQAKALTEGLGRLVANAHQRSADGMQEIARKQRETLVIALGAGAVALVMGCLLTFLVMRRILGAIGQASRMANLLAAGDLREGPRVQRTDEIGAMLRALDEARLAWIRAIGDIHGAASVVTQTAGAIAIGAGTLRHNSGRASENLRETSSSVGQLASDMHSSTEAARSANALANSATQLAQRSGSAVEGVVATMSEIETASRRITEIIAVIDGLAFQTNILALNAAVEAVRAGEQGRGFAVVAGEVRALANRSSVAAGEIRTLIARAVSGVGDGSERASDASKVIVDVRNEIARVDDAVRACSEAAGRQGNEITALLASIQSLEGVSRDNVEMIDEWTESAEQLRHESMRLDTLVRRFKLPADAPVPA